MLLIYINGKGGKEKEIIEVSLTLSKFVSYVVYLKKKKPEDMHFIFFNFIFFVIMFWF